MNKNQININILKSYSLENKEIYIFGADIVGKVIMEILEKNKIFIDGFIDNNKNKCSQEIKDYKVEHAPTKLLKIKKDSIILIASTYILDIINQIEKGFDYQVSLKSVDAKRASCQK